MSPVRGQQQVVVPRWYRARPSAYVPLTTSSGSTGFGLVEPSSTSVG